MAEQATHIKFAPPRPLTSEETQLTMQKWKVNFKQFIKRDSSYKGFLTAVWDSSRDNYNLRAETTGLMRTAPEMKENLLDFIHILASYLPHGYLTDKLLTKSTSFDSAFRMIEESYNLVPSQESYFDFITIKKMSSESYRQMYDRMVAFSIQHLMPASTNHQQVDVDGVVVPARGDSLSVSHLNMIALLWLSKIHPDLVSIIRTEYARELRENQPLSGLVPRISQNIDHLLVKYEKSPAVNLVSNQVPIEADVDQDADICRVRGGGGRGRGSFRGRGAGGQRNFPGGQSFCPGCFYLSKQMNAKINFSHNAAECPRKAATVMLLEAEDATFAQADYNNMAGESVAAHLANSSSNVDHQELLMKAESVSPEEKSSLNVENENDVLYENKSAAMISHIQKRVDSLIKASSPTLWLSFNDVCVQSVVDEGSELCCMDYETAQRAKIPIEKSDQKAKSADNKSMSIVGQSKFPLQVSVRGTRVPLTISLGKVVIINNLGCAILVGQPAKISNEIVVYPHKSKLSLKDVHGIQHTVSYPLPPPTDMSIHETIKTKSHTVLYPEDELTVSLPNQFSTVKRVTFSPRPNFEALAPVYTKVNSNLEITLTNSSSRPISIPKHAHIGDVRNAIDLDTAVISRLYTVNEETFKAYSPTVHWDRSENFVNDVQIDPDGIMTEDWKEKFKNLCSNFTDIIQYKPSVYNGYYGFVSNTIEFTTPPPPNSKTYVPRYSKEMTDKLAAKMDELLEIGVLVRPEDLGVTPMFVSPSMLVPKPGSKDFRLVTDFNKLNSFIRKMPANSPGIEETKLALANFKYLVTIDLSQFYFQNKTERKDSQYLGVIHPYKGTLLYGVSPMGLRNSGEINYERLTCIFGDMQKEQKVCRQADSIIVGGLTLDQLFANLTEVFHRLRTCNLTIKPSKLIIAPKKVELFGWEYSNQGWSPTVHTVNPLSVAPEPRTVKQLRSWLGAAKQLSPCLQEYAVHFSPLEKVLPNRKSQELIRWTPELSQHFKTAKNILQSIKTIHYPSPQDRISTYSDYSQEKHAIGGRMEFTRTLKDGTLKKFHGGFFSAKVTECQTRWNPCESEALACKVVLEHFKPVIRESMHVVTHYCDNAPTVQAFNRAKQGKFSVSSRISTFLLSVTSMNVEIVHKSGKNIPATDFFSRHPPECRNERCQICNFIAEEVFTGEYSIRQISATDIMNGTFSMPYIQPSAWIALQKKDHTISNLKKLIANGQQPEPRKTGGENTILKKLYSMFAEGKIKVANNGLVTSEFIDENSGQVYYPIVVPHTLYPGLVCAIHLKLAHPTKYQMTKLLSRYFLCPGSSRVISDVVDTCHTCLSLKPLPETLFSETTSVSNEFGARFSADIMVRNGQHIIFIVEKLTGFCFADILELENSSNIGKSIISLIGQFVSQNGCVIRTDGAAYFQKLRTESQEDGSAWRKLGITFELGNSLHTNKNPSAENIIKEAHSSINRLGYTGGLHSTDLVMVVKNINAKIRQHGYSSLELFTRRSAATGDDVVTSDSTIADKQLSTRLSSHNPPQPTSHEFCVGDLVMVKSKRDKLHGRDTYIINNFVTENDAQWAEVVKFGTKLVNKTHRVRVEDLVKVKTNPRPSRGSATRASEKIKSLIPLLKRIQSTLDAPTHTWRYEDVLDMILRGDEEFYTTIESSNENEEPLEDQHSEEEDQNSNEEDTSENVETDEDTFVDSQEIVADSPNQTLSTTPTEDGVDLLNPNLVQNMNAYLDNPSIAVNPQHHSQVNLNAVQNLDAAFETVFNSNLDATSANRRSERITAKPKLDYRAMHSGK